MHVSALVQILGLLGWLAISFVAAGIGAVASKDAKSFYGELAQPRWAPPSWLFGPVWTVLYALMGVSAWLVWQSGGFGVHAAALVFFLIQLTLNALWSWVFFSWHRGRWSLFNIIILWCFIVITIVLFWQASSLAGILLLPYLLWASFATALNYSVTRLNPQVL